MVVARTQPTVLPPAVHHALLLALRHVLALENGTTVARMTCVGIDDPRDQSWLALGRGTDTGVAHAFRLCAALLDEGRVLQQESVGCGLARLV